MDRKKPVSDKIVLMKTVAPHINFDFNKLVRYQEVDYSYFYRTILSVLPVVVVCPECTRTGFKIKGMIQLFSKKDMLSLSVEFKKANILYFYFKDDGVAYIDRDSQHFFEKGDKGQAEFEGNWTETLVEISKRLLASPNANEKQKLLIQAIANF